MKYQLIFFLGLLSLSTNAQKHLVGIQGGVNIADANGMYLPSQEPRTGIMAGITYEYQLKKHFSIGTDLRTNSVNANFLVPFVLS